MFIPPVWIQLKKKHKKLECQPAVIRSCGTVSSPEGKHMDGAISWSKALQCVVCSAD